MSSQVFDDEAHERWGDTDAYKESARRTKNYSAEDFALANKRAAEIVQDFIDAISSGLSAESEQAALAAEAHRQHITDWYYTCTYDIHVGLAQMYVADERFKNNYDSQYPGLAQYVHDAIIANAVNKS
jgi:hypothetical protein